MRQSFYVALSTAGLLFLAATTNSFAEPAAVTVTGEGKCAKCALKETAECQDVIQTKENGKTVTYYLTKNDVADSFHKNVCRSTKQVTAKGTVKDVNGKKELTATEIKTVAKAGESK